MAEGSLHIVRFPWLAFGHMIPFLELSKSLAKRGHHISFLSTPRNILRLPKLPPTLAPLIDFIPIHLPPSDDLPDNAEATIDLLPADVEHLKKAYDGLHHGQVSGASFSKIRLDHPRLHFTLGVADRRRAAHPVRHAQLVPGLLQRLPLWTGRRGDAEIRRTAHRRAGVDPLPDGSCLPPLRGPAVPLLAARRFFGVVRRLPFRSGRPTVQVHGSTRLHGMGSTTVTHHLGAFQQACRPGRPASSSCRRGRRKDGSH